MTVSEFKDGPYKDVLNRAYDIMWDKMQDYAKDSEAFHNFRRSAASAGLTPFQVWVVFADKHWGAITRYCRDGKVESEDIRDRLADLINYLCLLAGMIKEKENEGRAREPFGSGVEKERRILEPSALQGPRSTHPKSGSGI